MVALPRVRAAAAAAILTTKYIEDGARDELEEGQRFFVHPHVAELEPDESALASYLGDIYNSDRQVPIDVEPPGGRNGATFKALAASDQVAAITGAIAEQLRIAMESKQAKPGILFGFSLQHQHGVDGYGVIKADLEEDERFFLSLATDETWSLGQVQDMLPPPQTKYAKYAISPRPRQPGAVGIRDTQADPDSAADYFLNAVGLVVPRRKGTKLAVALAAKRHGHDDKYIREALTSVDEDRPVGEVLEEYFPDDAELMGEKLRGTQERPITTVVADDPFRRKYFTRDPRFELVVDEAVEVTVEGRTITVILPEGADHVESSYVK